MAIALSELPYGYDALQPVISSATLKLHHGAHHRGYIEKLNALIRDTDLDGAALDVIVRRSARDAAANPASRSIFNNAAQAWNHAFFWNSLRPIDRAAAPQGALAALIDADFGGQRKFAETFKSAASGLFGSGWVWLVEDGGTLGITATSNADTPILCDRRPLLVLDVWEHAYYLDHQNRRDTYVAGVVDHLLNWEFAERNFAQREAVHV
jgi:Fe-Mn family superoxide dismutase